MALAPGQSLELAKDGVNALRLVERLVGRNVACDQAPRKGLVQLLRPDAPPAVDGEIPCNADQPDAQVTNGGQGPAMFEDADEGVLNDVFGFCAAPQD